jgi:hypothetical protein
VEKASALYLVSNARFDLVSTGVDGLDVAASWRHSLSVAVIAPGEVGMENDARAPPCGPTERYRTT